jgi:hypothetical protein
MASPIIDLNDVTVFRNETISAVELFSAIDGGDPIVTYFFSDFRSSPGGGYFQRNGVPITNGSTFSVSADELSTIEYVGGNSVAFEGFKVVARDAIGNFSSPEVRGRIYTTQPNTNQPHVQAPAFPILADETIDGTQFISGFDPDGYPLTNFEITDGSRITAASANNGAMTVLSPRHNFVDGESVTIKGSTNGFNVTANINVINEHAFWFWASTVPTGTALGNMFAVDNGGSHFNYLGERKESGVPFFVSAANLDQLLYVGNGDDNTKNFSLKGFDGVDWSDEKTGVVDTSANINRPTVQLSSTQTPAEEFMPLEGRFRIFDVDGNTMKKYRFFNTSPHPSKGDLYLNGVPQSRDFWIEVDAANIGDISFKSDIPFDQQQIRVMGFDGQRWSAPGTLVVNTSEPDLRPVLQNQVSYVLSEQLRVLPARNFFSQGDIGQAHEVIEVYEGSLDPASGYLADGTVPLQAGVIHQFDAASFESNVNFYTGDFFSRNADWYYQRSQRNGKWSQWEKILIRTEPEYEDILANPGNPSWSNLVSSNAQGKDVISFSFMQQFPSYETGNATNGNPPRHFSVLSLEQRADARRVFRHLEGIINVQFLEVADTSVNEFGGQGGIIRMGNYGHPDDNAGAFAFLPPTSLPGATFFPQHGDMWFNRILGGFETSFTGFPEDEYGGYTFLHELGHALGLKHPHSGTPRLSPEVDTTGFSVMSYQNPDFFVYANTYQLYDIIELQELYGVNDTHRTGDDVYSIFANWERQRFVETIWDAGGNDTLSAVGSPKDSLIDLREGGKSSIGEMVENVTIAFGAQIEHGIGSAFNDSLFGNPLDNVLVGGAGDDYLMGNQGEDYLIGGAGNDTFEWGLGDHSDTIAETGGGNDTLLITRFPIVGTLEADFYFSKSGNDLYVNLAPDNGELEGTLRIAGQEIGESRVETLDVAGTRIDLAHLTSQVNTESDQNKFRLLQSSTPFGRMVELLA